MYRRMYRCCLFEQVWERHQLGSLDSVAKLVEHSRPWHSDLLRQRCLRSWARRRRLLPQSPARAQLLIHWAPTLTVRTKTLRRRRIQR
jgi:hypothetical protein